jgi:Na+/glutamate symporter
MGLKRDQNCGCELCDYARKGNIQALVLGGLYLAVVVSLHLSSQQNHIFITIIFTLSSLPHTIKYQKIKKRVGVGSGCLKHS